MVHKALTWDTLSALEPSEAAAYFIARRAEGLTSAEEQLLAGWLAKDEGHQRAFDSADRAWQSFAEADGDEVLAAMRAHARAPRTRTFTAWHWSAAVAAGLLLVVAALLIVPALNAPPDSQAGVAASGAAIQYASARGEIKELRLPDGSSMTLDADSIAVGRFGTEGRTVDLQRGRALFLVIPDQSRPFAVTAAGRSIVALGTRFDVNVVPDGLTVTLLDGHVQVQSRVPSVTPVMLEPGQQYVERRGETRVRTIGAATENAIAWRVGLISFDGQPLAEAAAVMNRYSSAQLVINDPDVASLPVSGQFPARDLQRFAATIAEVHKLRSTRQENRIELVRRE